MTECRRGWDVMLGAYLAGRSRDGEAMVGVGRDWMLEAGVEVIAHPRGGGRSTFTQELLRPTPLAVSA